MENHFHLAVMTPEGNFSHQRLEQNETFLPAGHLRIFGLLCLAGTCVPGDRGSTAEEVQTTKVLSPLSPTFLLPPLTHIHIDFSGPVMESFHHRLELAHRMAG
jgi:hypothetical protein